MARIKRIDDGSVRRDHDAQEKAVAPATMVAPPPPPVSAARKQPTRRRQRGRTSSERGHEFRRRQRQHELALEAQVAVLQKQVHDKLFLVGVWQSKYFRTRHSVFGPLVAVVREYYSLFQHGLRSMETLRNPSDRDAVRKQEAFLHSVMDPEATSGPDVHGPDGAINQWRLHSSAFRIYKGDLLANPTVVGSDAYPVVQVHTQVKAFIGHETVDVLFRPQGRVRAARLLAPCMDKLLAFPCRSQFAFTRNNLIVWENVEIDYAQGFSDAGLSVPEVAELLTLSLLTPHSTIQPQEEEKKKRI